MRKTTMLTLAAGIGLAALVSPAVATAFCGFYVSGADTKLYNNATQVVLMREGQRTVLSMQNNYQGPPANFAMVVPVPVILQKENVKTLPRAVFDRVDQLAAPRLVEYWEQDPCYSPPVYRGPKGAHKAAPMAARAVAESSADDMGVRIEAQFTVGEYEVVILSAQDAGGLDGWLKLNGYKIPDGAAPFLRPYVEAGSKFFVAKVDTSKVKFENGMATLSPLRFHYDSERFSLPVRLGLMNAQGPQDLIVHVLSRGKRYEVTNYPNVAIPTNLEVQNSAKQNFGAFYVSLFDKTLEKFPGAVVTEYSWDAGSCDPCPQPPLTPSEVSVLGADVIDAAAGQGDEIHAGRGRGRWGGGANGFVLTRLHARYTKAQLGDDLVFREAGPIVGGREFMRDGKKLEEGAAQDHINNFQGRYIIRHPWTGPIKCANPVRGRWGGPPTGSTSRPDAPVAARNLAFQPRNMQLVSFTGNPVPDSAFSFLAAATPVPPLPPAPPPGPALADAGPGAAGNTADAGEGLSDGGAAPAKVDPSARGCGCNTQPTRENALSALMTLGAVALFLRRNKKQRGSR
jgi:hypothetical protein